MKLKSFILALLCFAVVVSGAEPVSKDTAQWFKDAKFGIFVHWGIYAVDGSGASWPIYNKRMSYDQYMSQTNGFRAEKYVPESWAKLFKDAGAKYVVLTTKHHDGVALWDTRQLTKGERLSVVTKTPAGRDLVGPFVQAMRGAGLKVGLYYSWLDWSNPDYAAMGSWRSGEKPAGDKDERRKRWQRFLAFDEGQLRELCSLYKPDLLWFDGDWGVSSENWGMKDFRKKFKSWVPGVVLNSRMGGYGDYATPEQGVPVVPPKSYWELCMTINQTWGYSPRDTVHKSVNQLIRILAECVSMGGNLLLNVGPKADGTIRNQQMTVLKKMGGWLGENGEAVYGTVAGPARIHYGLPSTLSKDRKTLYLYVFDKPVNQLLFKGLINNPKRITLLSDGRELKSERVGGAPWSHVPGSLFVTVPQDIDIGYGVVVKIELDEPIKLYTGESGAIEQN